MPAAEAFRCRVRIEHEGMSRSDGCIAQAATIEHEPEGVRTEKIQKIAQAGDLLVLYASHVHVGYFGCVGGTTKCIALRSGTGSWDSRCRPVNCVVNTTFSTVGDETIHIKLYTCMCCIVSLCRLVLVMLRCDARSLC